MPLQFSTAPALFLGLGARVVLDTFNRTQQASPIEPSISNFLLLGAWQGVGLYYAMMEFPDVAIIVALAIGAKLFIEFTILPDVTKCAVTLIGVALGVMFTDVLSQFLEDGSWTSFGGKRRSSSRHETTAHVSTSKHRARTVSFSRSKSGDTRRDREKERERERTRLHAHSDITAPSLDSTSDWIDRTARTPLEREVATLRARASLADTEKRRYKEERIWALAQGNQARAEQMAWQVKRYRALTHGFHKEADAKLLETKATAKPAPVASTSRPVASSSRLRQTNTTIRPVPAPASDRRRRSGSYDDSVIDPPANPADSKIAPAGYRRHRKQSSGTLKSAIRPTKYG